VVQTKRQQRTRSASKEIGRRRFLAQAGVSACSVGLLGLGLGLYARRGQTLPVTALRPPGALAEADFLAACVRCGLCVRDCPYDTLKLADLGDSVATGTPYFEARKIPCEMCEDIPCVVACPTGALDPELKDIDDADMGLAVLIDQEECLNFQGLRCDVCYRVCPVIDEAITLELRQNQRTGVHALFIPTVHSEYCTGCGKCEQSCVLGESAIKVLPRKVAKIKKDEHYRLGWEEEEKAGRQLVPEILKLPTRRPESVQ
jgi:ferredoxin-type protein NapG